MKYPIFSIYDSVTRQYSIPAIHSNDAAAMRNFAEVFKDVFQPEDYSLYCIGEFDNENGTVSSIDSYVVCRATDFVKGEKDNG